MPTLRCSLSKEVRSESRGRTASVSLEVELSAETLKNPMLLKKHIRCGFNRVRAAIEVELAGPVGAKAALAGDERTPLPRGRDGNAGDDRPVTANQLWLLRMLAERGDRNVAAVCRERFGKPNVSNLSTREASSLINALNGLPKPKGRR